MILIGELEANSISLETLQEEITEYLRFAARFSELINEPELDAEKLELLHTTNTDLLRV